MIALLMKNTVLSFAFALLVAPLANTGLANLLLNPSFEEPRLSSSSLLIGPGFIGPGWQTPGIVLLLESGALGSPNTGDGGQLLAVAGTTVFQEVELSPFTTHRLVFELGGDDAIGGTAIVDVLRNGTSVIGGDRLFSTNGRFFEAKEIVFDSLEAGTYQLILNSQGGYFDAFSLVSVPEPSSILLLGLSAFGLISARLRFR